MATKKNSKSSKKSTNYEYVAPNIYRDGTAFRARVSVNGVRMSLNCQSKAAAIRWRNEQLSYQS